MCSYFTNIMSDRLFHYSYNFLFAKVLTSFGGKVRGDRRCGKEFPLKDGSPSECDGTSENPCCSQWGFCGPDADHCACDKCIDYRSPDEQGSSIIFVSSYPFCNKNIDGN